MSLLPAAMPTRPSIDPLIRVFIAEDHAITLWGLQRLVDSSAPRMKVVGSASTREALLNHAALAEADVILLDLDLGGESAADSLADLQRRSAAQILVLTGADDSEQHRAVVLKGARGVLHKSEPAQTILQAIEKVHGGEIWLNRSLLGEVLGQLTGRSTRPHEEDPMARRIAGLTPRERQIVATMVKMAGAKQIAVAEALTMSEHTLRNHLTTIYSKLALHGRLELHLFAIEHGLGAVRDGGKA